LHRVPLRDSHGSPQARPLYFFEQQTHDSDADSAIREVQEKRRLPFVTVEPALSHGKGQILADHRSFAREWRSITTLHPGA
jgi:hypothetical protein